MSFLWAVGDLGLAGAEDVAGGTGEEKSAIIGIAATVGGGGDTETRFIWEFDD